MNAMKKAWEIARDGQKKFGGKIKEYFAIALKMAWAQLKLVAADETGSVKLVGTEKQVKWAEEIRKNVVEGFEIATEDFIESLKQEGRTKRLPKRIEAINAIREQYLTSEDAAYWINNFKTAARMNMTEEQKREGVSSALHNLDYMIRNSEDSTPSTGIVSQSLVVCYRESTSK